VLKLVADTNTVVSALLWHGAPHRLFEAIGTGKLSFYASDALIAELTDVLGRRKLARAVAASGKKVPALVYVYKNAVELVPSYRVTRTSLSSSATAASA
jgi:putative PIN family toxin of toxin-antitoxin system